MQQARPFGSEVGVLMPLDWNQVKIVFDIDIRFRLNRDHGRIRRQGAEHGLLIEPSIGLEILFFNQTL